MNHTPTQELTIYIVEDDKDICEALVWAMNSVSLKTAVFHEAQSFLQHFNAKIAGCIVLDIRMPGMSGLDLQKQLIKIDRDVPIIFITGHGDISMAVRAMRNGAFDFLTKPFNTQHLLELIQRAQMMRFASQTQREKRTDMVEKFSALTSQEKIIVYHIAEGKMNKEIATALNIAISTVELYRSKIMRKLDAKNLPELIKAYLLFEKQTEHASISSI